MRYTLLWLLPMIMCPQNPTSSVTWVEGIGKQGNGEVGLEVRENSLWVFGGKSLKFVLQQSPTVSQVSRARNCRHSRPSDGSEDVVASGVTTTKRRRQAGVC